MENNVEEKRSKKQTARVAYRSQLDEICLSVHSKFWNILTFRDKTADEIGELERRGEQRRERRSDWSMKNLAETKPEKVTAASASIEW